MPAALVELDFSGNRVLPAAGRALDAGIGAVVEPIGLVQPVDAQCAVIVELFDLAGATDVLDVEHSVVAACWTNQVRRDLRKRWNRQNGAIPVRWFAK